MAVTQNKYLYATESASSSTRKQYLVSGDYGPADILRKAEIGFLDFNDSATSGTPITIPTGLVWTLLTNDKSGGFTNVAYPPQGVTTALWNSSTNSFSWAELALGDMLDIRFDATVTTSSANQVVNVDLFLAVGSGSAYQIPFIRGEYKTAGAHNVVSTTFVYMGNADTLNSPAQFKMQSDAAATCVVNGWAVKIIKRGTY